METGKNQNRDFEEVINAIKNAELDVDEFLEAARLQRHEGTPRYLNAEQKMWIIVLLIAVTGALIFASFLFK